MTSTNTIVEYLSRVATERPSQIAIIAPDGYLTFKELENKIDVCALGLKRAGIRFGTRTVLMLTPGINFIVLTFALMKINAVPVLVDPGLGWSPLKKCLEDSKPEAFIGIPLAQFARILFRWARTTIRIRITVGGYRYFGGFSLEQIMQLGIDNQGLADETTKSDDPAAILFTSGSTGAPKGVMYTHGMFFAQACLLRETYQIQPGEIDLATFPLFALFDPLLGVTSVIPKMDFTRPGKVDPLKIITPIQKYNITHMFGSPALLDRVGRYGTRNRIRLPSLRRVLSAGAPVSLKILERFSDMLLPQAVMHTPYGSTEALPVCSISGQEISKETGSSEGKGVCIGHPISGVKLAVIKITDASIPIWTNDLLAPPGEIGELVVWGPNVSREYFNNPSANELAKINGHQGEIRHRMGDLGYLDPKGRVWFCGRKSHRVITPLGTLFSVPCEGIFNQHPKVYRSALVGLGNPCEQQPIICVELEEKEKIQWSRSEELKREILNLGAQYPQTNEITTLLFHPSFPVDIRHNAKILRHKLAQWASMKIS